MCGWWRCDGGSGVYRICYSWENSVGPYIGISNLDLLFAYGGVSDTSVGFTPRIGEPFFLGYTSADGLLRVYARRLNSRSWDGVLHTPVSLGFGSTFGVGGDQANEPWNGIFWDQKCWDAPLTSELLLKQSFQRDPVMESRLHFHWLLDSSADLRDFSANGRPPSTVGTITSAGRHQINRRRRSTLFDRIAVISGGSLFTISLGGTLTPAGGLLRQTNKNLGGTLTPVGAASKRIGKLLAGTVAPAGALTKQTRKSFGGTLTPSGSLAVTLVFLKAVAGTLTPVGSLTKMTIKALAGVLSPVGTLVKQTRKVLAGTLSPAGSLTKQTSKKLTGTVTPTGTLTPAAVILKALAGTLSFIGSLATLFIPFVPPSGTIRRYWRSIWSRQWRDPGQKDIDN